MRLQLSTWMEVEEYLKNNNSIIIPIGSTEQHGPNGLIGTDAITSEKISHLIGDEHNILVAPTINIGMAQHHLGFPGSMTLRPSTFIAMIGDVVKSLICHGFRHIFFVNGHGGNIASMEAAFSELYADYSFAQEKCNFKCKLTNWYMGERLPQRC